MHPVDRRLLSNRFLGIVGNVEPTVTLLFGEVHCSVCDWLGACHDWRLSYSTQHPASAMRLGDGPWRGDRVADCAGLEIQCGSNITVGSNPTLSASSMLLGVNAA